MDTGAAIVTLVASIVGSTGLATLIQFLISRRDKYNDHLAKIDESLNRIECRLDDGEKNSARTQLILMISIYPEDTSEIMKLGEYYFSDLKGDWYMTSIFNKWLVSKNIASPDWFNPSK